MPDLGFDYPPLRPARRALEALHCRPTPERSTVAAAYQSALRRLAPVGAEPDAHAAALAADPAAALLRRFVDQALVHVEGEGRALPCRLDPTLPPLSTGNGGGARGKRVLFASNLSNSGTLAPNMIVQLLHVALLLPPGQLAVSVFESGSNDLTRQWLSLLRMLLVPLGVPHNITLGGGLRPRPGGDRIAFMAELRNAALDPFLADDDGSGSSSSSSSSSSSRRRQGMRAAWRPDAVVFANDVFWCAGDALRLLAHGADLACGLDFYTGPWQAPGAAGAGGAADSSGGSAADEDEDDVMLLRGLGELDEAAGSVGQQQLRLRRRLQRAGRLSSQQEQPRVVDGEAASSRALPLRFYDKVRPASQRHLDNAKNSTINPFEPQHRAPSPNARSLETPLTVGGP
jgi:hypothetical protein